MRLENPPECLLSPYFGPPPQVSLNGEENGIEKEKCAIELSFYRPSIAKEEELQKLTNSANTNVGNIVWMSRDLEFHNSEYVYAISPVSIALFW